MNRILNWREAADIRDIARSEGRTVVLTNGVFDVIHPGHIRMLEKSRSLGGVLIVALNSDSSVRQIKGPDRPINSEQDRASVLAGLRSVDYVVLFDAPEPLAIIQAIKPDVLTKGGDWTRETIIGAPEVEAYGGVVVVVPTVQGHSTTKIVEKIRKG